MNTNQKTKMATSRSNSIPKLTAKAQKVFNAYIRKRDNGLLCISCGQRQGDQAGHYLPVKQYSALRFDENNVNLQCSYCNLYLHGNQVFYRKGLIAKIGAKAVEDLENMAITNRIKKWSRSELEEIIEKYKL